METYDIDAFKDELQELLKGIPEHYTNETPCLTYEEVFPESNKFNAWLDKLKLLSGYKRCPKCGMVNPLGEKCPRCENWKMLSEKMKEIKKRHKA